MNPNAKTLAMRDPALALLVGAIEGDDFGGESDFGYEFGDDYGFEFGDEHGAEDVAAMAAPSSATVQAMWNRSRAEAANTHRRAMLLEPNRNSKVKVERYTFGISTTLVLGTPSSIDISGNPDTNIRPQRVTMNAPVPGFASISDIKVANVSAGVGGSLDAFQFNANGVGQTLDLPTLSPANRARVSGTYAGLTPTGYTAAANFLFVASFTGPASIVA